MTIHFRTGSAFLVVAVLAVLASLLTAPSGSAAGTLLSQNKRAVASSIQQMSATYDPGHVTDGNLSTRWASTNGHDPEWIYIDLGAPAAIDRVVIRWWSSFAVAYEIQTSNDATNWVAVHATANGDGAVDDIAVAASGRYVRMFG